MFIEQSTYQLRVSDRIICDYQVGLKGTKHLEVEIVDWMTLSDFPRLCTFAQLSLYAAKLICNP